MNVCFKVNEKEVFNVEINTLKEVVDTLRTLNKRYENEKVDVFLISENGISQVLNIKGLVVKTVA